MIMICGSVVIETSNGEDVESRDPRIAIIEYLNKNKNIL